VLQPEKVRLPCSWDIKKRGTCFPVHSQRAAVVDHEQDELCGKAVSLLYSQLSRLIYRHGSSFILARVDVSLSWPRLVYGLARLVASGERFIAHPRGYITINGSWLVNAAKALNWEEACKG
jgi:hypothetical protein